MTSRELLYVKTIAEEKSISRAARKLYIAQPSLSQSLQKIEENLGTTLFRRTPTGLTMTYSGERYYHMATQILKMYENFEIEISDINNLKTGRVHLGITNYLGTLILPHTLKRFQEICPFVEVLVTEDNTSNLEKRLLVGELDFVVMHAPKEERHTQLDYENLERDPFVLVMPPDHPLIEKAQKTDGYPYPVLDIRLLNNQTMIMLDRQQRIRQVTDSILKRAQVSQIRTALTLKNFITAQLLASQGLGITMVPLQYSQLTIRQCEPILLSIDHRYEAYWDMCIATLKDNFLSKADQLFIRCIKENCQESGPSSETIPKATP